MKEMHNGVKQFAAAAKAGHSYAGAEGGDANNQHEFIDFIYPLAFGLPATVPRIGCLKFCTLPVLLSPKKSKKQDGMLAFF